MTKALIAAITATAMLTTGCASIISDHNWPVAVTSTPDHAEYSIKNKAGKTVATGTTPNTVILPSAEGYGRGETYTIGFTKDGYAPNDVVLDSSINGWYLCNILFGGIVGLLIVDPITGAMWKLPGEAHANLAPAVAKD